MFRGRARREVVLQVRQAEHHGLDAVLAPAEHHALEIDPENLRLLVRARHHVELLAHLRHQQRARTHVVDRAPSLVRRRRFLLFLVRIVVVRVFAAFANVRFSLLFLLARRIVVAADGPTAERLRGKLRDASSEHGGDARLERVALQLELAAQDAPQVQHDAPRDMDAGGVQSAVLVVLALVRARHGRRPRDFAKQVDVQAPRALRQKPEALALDLKPDDRVGVERQHRRDEPAEQRALVVEGVALHVPGDGVLRTPHPRGLVVVVVFVGIVFGCFGPNSVFSVSVVDASAPSQRKRQPPPRRATVRGEAQAYRQNRVVLRVRKELAARPADGFHAQHPHGGHGRARDARARERVVGPTRARNIFRFFIRREAERIGARRRARLVGGLRHLRRAGAVGSVPEPGARSRAFHRGRGGRGTDPRKRSDVRVRVRRRRLRVSPRGGGASARRYH